MLATAATVSTGLVIRPDWMRVSLRGRDALGRARAMFGGDKGLSWDETGKGMWFYGSCSARGGVRIFHDSKHEHMSDTVTVEVSGQACRQLETEGVIKDWQAFCKLVAKECCNVARFDVSFDAHGLKWEKVRDAVDSGAVLSRFRAPVRETATRDKRGVKTGGDQTFYWGAAGSDTVLTIYDKASEQLLEGQDWVRFELRTANERAIAVVNAIAERGMTAPLKHLVAVWDLRDFAATQDTNKSRAPRLQWWDELVQNADACRVKVHKEVVKSIEKSKEWLIKQVSRSLSVIHEAYGDVFIDAMLSEGKAKRRPEQTAMLQSHALFNWGQLSVASA